jgi:hypothetical protein
MKVRHMMWRDFQSGDFGEDLLRAYYAEVPHEGVPAGGLLASLRGESAPVLTVRLKPDTTYFGGSDSGLNRPSRSQTVSART